MPKTKQQKQKERERRVAKEKLEAAAQRRTQQKTEGENKPPVSQLSRQIGEDATAKANHVPVSPKASFSHRRMGGGG